jgi:hypothetical protein
VDKGDAATSWANASALFRARLKESDWAKALAGARQPLGDLVRRALQGGKQVSELPGAPDGDYVVLTYGSEFENKRAAVETVTPMRDRDNEWRVSGYFIR